MASKRKSIANKDSGKTPLVYTIDPKECPFREFRDNELGVDYWGMGPAAFRAAMQLSKAAPKLNAEAVWTDDQAQPLPRSVRHYLHGWVRAEHLASDRYNCEVAVFEDMDHAKTEMASMQLGHAQVLRRSSFCRLVLSVCYMLERADSLVVEHQWEGFLFSFAEGWLPRYHIYAPGMKSGGGSQHRPHLSKNGCYLVRLYYLGAWRCVWVNDTVPIDTSGAPLLPFSPLITPVLSKHPTPPGAKPLMVNVVSRTIHLWPVLLCKALLKLLAPDMSADSQSIDAEDEEILDFDITHCLTGGMRIRIAYNDTEELWNILYKEVPVFSWDDDDETQASTAKTKSTKKPSAKETVAPRRNSLMSMQIKDTGDVATYILPGIAPGYRMQLLVAVVRNIPLKKPLPEPEVPLWKTYRWVDWARSHGLYDAYYCPKTKFLKVSGLLKLSHAPHLLDVQSTESITAAFRDEQDKANPKKGKDKDKQDAEKLPMQLQQLKEELREWVLFESINSLVEIVDVTYYPGSFQFSTTTSHPSIRNTRSLPNKFFDVPAPKGGPLYFQIDNHDVNVLRISLQVLNPRILFNCGAAITDFYEHSYFVLERFEWFLDSEIAVAKAHIETNGYDSLEIKFDPGRHYCRLWMNSRMHWHIAMLSESTLLLGTRDLIMAASVRECPWASRFLNNLGQCFNSWIRTSRSGTSLNTRRYDKEFMKSYQPDLEWDPKVVGYKKDLLHWMFRRAIESVLLRKASTTDLRPVCMVLRKYLADPDFGFPPKPAITRSLREIIGLDPCDCKIPEPEGEEVEIVHEEVDQENQAEIPEAKSLVSSEIMRQILNAPDLQHPSRICEHATIDIPCGILKEERELFIVKNEAATIIQAYWRGTWARKCLNNNVVITQDIIKTMNEAAFGHLDALSSLMFEFFRMYPGAKYAYSVSTALSGMNGIRQYIGNAPLTPRCKWIPFFQGVFRCHAPVKVHLDVQCSSLQAHSTVNIFNNDTQTQLPQAHSAHITFDIIPNTLGYTVMGHGSLLEPLGIYNDIHWQLTVLTSIDKVFHVCDMDSESCKEITLPSASKLHIDELYLPNRRKVLGSIHISVFTEESINFRAAASEPDLEMEAVLKTTNHEGETTECGRCSGKGELYWPFIQLAPQSTTSNTTAAKQKSMSQNNLQADIVKESGNTSRSLKTPKKANPNSAKKSQIKGPRSDSRHISKVKFDNNIGLLGESRKSINSSSNNSVKDGKSLTVETPVKYYFIEVTATNGWPLNLAQWVRVKEIMNSPDYGRTEGIQKKNLKEKGTSGSKEKEKSIHSILPLPQPGDAFVELECSIANNGGVIVNRNDQRDLNFIAEKKSWEAHEHGRNAKCAHIRKDFRAEFLEVLTTPAADDESLVEETINVEAIDEALESKKEDSLDQQQGPTPVTESETVEQSVESEEETVFLTMPEVLKDKFIQLSFVPLCTLDKKEETIVLTPELKQQFDEEEKIQVEQSQERMKELQAYNDHNVLGRQKLRNALIEHLYIDSQWDPYVANALEERDEAVMQESLARQQLSLTKKKQDVKKK